MEATTLDLERRLRFAGLRVTRSRTTVLTAVHAHPHADTDMVVDAARRTLSDLSRQAVHDSLRALVEVGLVRQFQLGSVVRFEEAQTHDDHHHAVCTSCGRIANVDCVGGRPSCPSPADSRGFLVSAVEVVYRGLCPDCATRSGETPRLSDRRHDGSHAEDGTRPEPEPLVRPQPVAPAPGPRDAAVVAGVPPSVSSRRTRAGRAASGPSPEPPSSRPGAPHPWAPFDPPLTEGRPAARPGPTPLPSPPEASPHAPERAAPAARDTRPVWFQAEPRHALSRRDVNKLAGPTVLDDGVDHGTPGTGATPSPTADAPLTRRRARHEAARPHLSELSRQN